MIAPAQVNHKRGLVRSVISPHPLADTLPALFQGDDFTRRFVSAFDAALAPIFVTLDNLTAYLDPWLAPDDFLEWLGGWFGLILDEGWSIERRRAVLANAFEFYPAVRHRRRGHLNDGRGGAPRIAELRRHGSDHSGRSIDNLGGPARCAGGRRQAGPHHAQSRGCQTG